MNGEEIAEVLRSELLNLWHDLALAQEQSWTPQGKKSIREEELEDRIKRLIPLVELTCWGQVPCTLLLNGTYERIAHEMGYKVPVPADAHGHCHHPEGYR